MLYQMRVQFHSSISFLHFILHQLFIFLTLQSVFLNFSIRYVLDHRIILCNLHSLGYSTGRDIMPQGNRITTQKRLLLQHRCGRHNLQKRLPSLQTQSSIERRQTAQALQYFCSEILGYKSPSSNIGQARRDERGLDRLNWKSYGTS